MSTSAALLKTSPSFSHPFLDALGRATKGRITIALPYGEGFDVGATGIPSQATWTIHDTTALDNAVLHGQIGFAEDYMDGKWETDNLPALLTFMLLNTSTIEKFFYGRPWYALQVKLRNLMQRNSINGSKRNIASHYDLGNEFYALWLDSSMTYSSALFQGRDDVSLEDAQQAKYQRILDKLQAKPGDTILEIGCGWGGFMEKAAKQGLNVTGITISEEQKKFAEERLQRQGLDQLAHVELRDYRLIEQKFDHIVSIGMFEHVGSAFWPVYFESIKRLLKPGGKAIVQSITIDDDVYENSMGKTGFIEKYIFPGGELPSRSRFKKAAQAAGLQCHEMFGFGHDYARTLTHWQNRFVAHLPAIRKIGYDEHFIRMWKFYLSCCIAAFNTERTSVMQAELQA